MVKDLCWCPISQSMSRCFMFSLLGLFSGFNATHISLVFDHDDSDNSSSDKADSHEVFYVVNGQTTNPAFNANHAKMRFREALPTGNFMFGFDPEEDAQLDAEEDRLSTLPTTTLGGDNLKNFTAANGWEEVAVSSSGRNSVRLRAHCNRKLAK